MSDAISIFQIGTIGLLHLFAVASPGPDFFIILRNGMRNGRRGGIQTALGVNAANFIFVILTLVGFAQILRASPQVLGGVQVLGGSYLAYLGFKMFKGAFASPVAEVAQEAQTDSVQKGAFAQGFFTSITNPKAMIYYASVLSPFVVNATAASLVSLSTVILLISLFWFVFIAWVASSPVSALLKKYARGIDGFAGVLFIGFGLYVLGPVLVSKFS